jgi:hypothetical protein
VHLPLDGKQQRALRQQQVLLLRLAACLLPTQWQRLVLQDSLAGQLHVQKRQDRTQMLSASSSRCGANATQPGLLLRFIDSSQDRSSAMQAVRSAQLTPYMRS